MSFSFPKLKAAGLPKTSAKLSRMAAGSKVPSLSKLKTKIPRGKAYKGFDFSKFSKAAKIPKPKKLAIIKKVIKRSK